MQNVRTREPSSVRCALKMGENQKQQHEAFGEQAESVNNEENYLDGLEPDQRDSANDGNAVRHHVERYFLRRQLGVAIVLIGGLADPAEDKHAHEADPH